MPGSEGDGWVSTREASEVLGYGTFWTIQFLKHEAVGNKRRGGGKRAALLWDKAEVERLARERRPVREQQALGLKWCRGCRQWRKVTEFHKRCPVCKACRPAYDRERKANQLPRTFANRKPEVSDGAGDWHIGEPPTPRSALRYRCLDLGYHHRPPVVKDGKRVSKRQSFCKTCTAARCYFHPQLTPAAVRKSKHIRREVEEAA
jgi:hypothetical protein